MVLSGFQSITGLGHCPSDWLVKSADELTSKITKGTTPPKTEIVLDSKIPFLRVNNLGFNGELNSSSDMIFVTQDAHNSFLSRSVAYPGDILMNIVGPPLGKIAMLNQDFDEYNMNQAIVIYRTESSKVDKDYFLNFLSSELAQQWLQSRSKKTSGQQNLTIQLCKELPVPVPPLKEQQKIAKILSTWDKAINTTERLIDNSTQQKKALMQQLLTGKKRLLDDEGKRFEGEWKEKTLGQYVTIKSGVSPSKFKLKSEGEVPYVKVEDMNNCSKYQIHSRNYADETKSVIFQGAVIFPKRGAAIMNNKVRIAASKLYLDSNMMALIPNKDLDSEFLYYLLLKKQLFKIADTSTIPQINNKHITPYVFKLPSLPEQQKIATVLTNADKEIELLEQQLADLQQEKKALMQVLLTGKRRVV